MSRDDLHWLAGLLEGEGCFIYFRTPYQQDRPGIQLKMTDKDVVERAAKLLNAPSVRSQDQPDRKRTFVCTTTGESAAEMMRRLLPLMGERRGAKIREILDEWDNRTDKPLISYRDRYRGFGSNVRPKRVVR